MFMPVAEPYSDAMPTSETNHDHQQLPPVGADAKTATAASPARATTVIVRNSVPNLLAVYVLSFAAMVPWPVLAILGLRALDAIDKWWELSFVFGGITLLLLIPAAIFINLPDAAYAATALLAWLVALAIVPPVIRSKWKTRFAMYATIIGLGVFSLGQALLGAMMIVGKSV